MDLFLRIRYCRKESGCVEDAKVCVLKLTGYLSVFLLRLRWSSTKLRNP